jgi:hypothetical protein
MLFLLRDFLEEDVLSGVFVGIGRELVVREFVGIDDVFGIAEPLCPPLCAVPGNLAYEKVTRSALDGVFSQFDTEALDGDFHDKLSLVRQILDGPESRDEGSFASHFHRDGCFSAGFESDSAYTDDGRGNFPIGFEGEFPSAPVRSPRSDEKGGELTFILDCHLYAAVFYVVPAAGVQ